METVIALVLFLSILTGCAGETLTNVKSSSITPHAAQTEEAVRYTVETETCADTIQAEDGTELLVYQFEVPELEVCRADGEIVNEAETDQEEQALTAAETFNARFADWLDGSSLDVFLEAAKEELEFSRAEGLNWSPYTLELQCEVYQNDRMVSVSGTYYSNTGGAHPNTAVLSWNFDLREGTFFTPALLAADSDEFLKAVEQELNVQALQIAADADLPPEEYFWADYTDILRDWVNYSVSFDETGMTVAFSPYELACYAAGEQVFHLPYDQILPYLSEHGKRVLGISQED